MREAKYARARAATGRPAPTTTGPAEPAPVAPPARKKAAAKKAAPVVEASDAESDAGAVCGHRNMSGRTCTREPGHAAKSHRYS